MGQLVEAVEISKGWWLTAGCFALVSSYTVAINVFPSFRQALDRVKVEGGDGKVDMEMQAAARKERGAADSVPSSPVELRHR